MVLNEESPGFLRTVRKFSSSLQRTATLILACVALSFAVGCGAANLGNSARNTQPQIQVTVSPSSAALTPGSRQQFTATVRGTSNSGVNWWASAGSISPDGAFTSPSSAIGSSIMITAMSAADPAQQATSLVTLRAAAPLSISTSSLLQAVVNSPYAVTLSATGGTPPYSWTTSAGSSAPGIRLASATGAFNGTPTQPGKYPFTVKVTDAASHSATQSFTLSVSAVQSTGNFDGPAELPRVYLSTTMADTPTPGTTLSVKAGGDLQSAVDHASCGDTIALQAGATFSTLGLTLPAKACDDQHWIVIRTSTPDATLPAEGNRMTPCYAGVASLPGRPAFSCGQPQRLLATITYQGAASGPIVFASGANHYRLIGLEITRVASNGNPVVALIAPELGGSADHIVLDRLYIHGTPRDETRRGVALSGSTNIAVQDSYISDFHCNVQGACTDSQAVSGGTGSLPTGPIRVVDNFLEAAGENVIFGGGTADQTPADIEIRLNHFFKPMFWMKGQPGFAGPAFVVKNHFELKNAQRVLFDSNVLENSWGGFSQSGFSIVLTPKNQTIANRSVCPLCQVTDVTVRNVTISHVGGGFQIANVLDDGGGAAKAGERYSIHDVIVDDIDDVKYSGHGVFAQVSTIASPLLKDVSIDHITAFPPHAMLNTSAPPGVQMPGFSFTNTIVTSGEYAITSTGAFGTADCANSDIPKVTVKLCFSGYSFASNAILDAPAQYPSSMWPSGNWFYNSPEAMSFVNYNNGKSGDYHLLASSPAKGAATDGTDLGANVKAVLAAVSSVR